MAGRGWSHLYSVFDCFYDVPFVCIWCPRCSRFSSRNRKFSKLAFSKFSCQCLSHVEYIELWPSILFPYSRQLKPFCKQRTKDLFRVPFSVTIIKFQYDFDPYKSAGFHMVFSHVIIYDALLLQLAILCRPEALYVGHDIFFKQTFA